MAPTIAIPPSSTDPHKHKHVPRVLAKNNTKKDQQLEELQKKNAELERALRDSQEREQHLAHQLRKALERVGVAEEAEELLCSQLSDLEVDAVEQARHFHAQISALKLQLQLLHLQSTTT